MNLTNYIEVKEQSGKVKRFFRELQTFNSIGTIFADLYVSFIKELFFLPFLCIGVKSVHSVLAHLAYKRSVRNSSGNAFLRCEVGQRILILKKSTFIASPMLKVLSQTEIKLNWLPVTPFL